MRSAYGDLVEVYESSAASAAHCWLRIYDDGQSVVRHERAGDMMAHLTVEQATAVRDRLTRAGDCYCGWRAEFGDANWDEHQPLRGFTKP